MADLALRDRLSGAFSHLRAGWDLLTKTAGTLSLATWESGSPYGAPPSAWSWLSPTSDQNLLQGYANSPWAHIKFLRLCSAVAMMEWEVKAKAGPGQEPKPLPEDYPLAVLLREPNPVLTGWDFTFLTELYIRTTGEVYWRVERGGLGRPKALWIYPRFWVRPNRDQKSRQVASYTLPFLKETIPAQDMIWLHTPDPVDPYVRGLGDLLASATEVETFEYASESDKNFFLRDATPDIILNLPGTPKKEQRDEFREGWRRKYGGFRNRGEPGLLWGGATVERLRSTHKEMEFVQGQKWLRDTIIAGVHPHILGVSEGVNRAQAEAAEYTFARWEILPRAKWHQQVRNKYLAPQFDSRAFMVYINVVPEDADRLLKLAGDPIATEGMSIDDRLALLSRAFGGIKPIGGELGASRVYNISRVVVSGTQNGSGKPARERPREEPEKPAPENPKPRRSIKRINLRDVLAALGLEDAIDLLWRYLSPAYEQVLEARWEQAIEEVGVDIAFDVADPQVAGFLSEAAGSRIRGIVQTQLERLRRELGEGVEAGESIADLTRRVASVFENMKRSRAEMIARTETIKASNQAAVIAYQKAGVERIEWLVAPDYTPEIDDGECGVLDGKVVMVGEDFAPGVPYPPAHVNCRCAVSAVLESPEGWRRLYEGEHRKQHITALGLSHDRLERMFLSSVRRGMQAWQSAVTRRLRASSEEAA